MQDQKTRDFLERVLVPADVLAELERISIELRGTGVHAGRLVMREHRNSLVVWGDELIRARRAVAALIARNAELEAERDEAACLASDVVGSLRIIKDVVASIAAERDALADEVKALDSEACKLRGELYTLRNMLEGYEVSVQRNQLHGAGLTYLTEVQLFREFQPGVGESHAEWWKKTLARASSATGGGNG